MSENPLSRPLELQSPGLLKQFMDVSFVPLQLSSLCKSFLSTSEVIHGKSCFNPFVRFSSLSLSLMPFSTFYATHCQTHFVSTSPWYFAFHPTRTTASNPFPSSSMASLSVDGLVKSLFLWTIENSRAWLLRTLSLPHKKPSSNILWAALLKIDNASCSKYFIREVSQSWSQQSCKALRAMLQSARTKFFCSDNYQATSCCDLFPVQILRNCNQSTRVKLIVTSELLLFELG